MHLPGLSESGPKALGVLVLSAALVTAGIVAVLGEPNADAAAPATENMHAPRGLHLSWTQDPSTTLTVTWFTNGTSDPGTIVQYADETEVISETEAEVDPSELIHTATGGTEKAPGIDVLVHNATMTGLTAGKDIFYRVGSQEGWSDVYKAKTAPADESYTFIVFGDMGLSHEASLVRQDIYEYVEQGTLDFIFIAGDISYADDDQPEWDQFYNRIERISARVPVMVAPGNHELEEVNGQTTLDPYIKRHAMPGEETYYGIDIANLHLTVLTSDDDSQDRTGSDSDAPVDFRDMVQFVEQDLADASQRRNAGEIDHLVVLQHHQLWSNHCDFSRQVQTHNIAWEDALLARYNVDLLLVGHNHHYERTFPMAFGTPTSLAQSEYNNPEGYIEVITGGAGRSLYCFQEEGDFYPFSASHSKRYHYTLMEVDGSSITSKAISSVFLPGQELDHFWLRNGPEQIGGGPRAPADLSLPGLTAHARG